MKSYITDLYLVNQDFLQLLGRKLKQAEVNKEVERELEVLNNFYEVVLNILQRADVESHSSRLFTLNEHVKGKILESELRKAYNELYSAGNVELLTRLTKNTALLSKKQVEEPIAIK